MNFANYPSLKGKVVFITGGTSGIGADFVLHFAQQQAKVAFIGRNKENGTQVCKEVSKHAKHQPLFIAGDVSDTNTIKAAIKETEQKFGPIHVLINNAANDFRHRTLDVTNELWQELMDINLKHQFFTAQAILPMMIANQQGSIINLSSNCFMLAEIPSYPLYATAKSAIIGMTRALAREFGPHNIRVNCILPGWVMTTKQREHWVTEDALNKTLHEQSLKKELMPADVSRLALFLAADDSQLISKQSFIIDGGRL